MDSKFTYTNIVVLGYVLTIFAVVLNAFAATNLPSGMNKAGVVEAILALGLAYAHQNALYHLQTRPFVHRSPTSPCKLTYKLNLLNMLVIVLTMAAYISWLFNVY